MRWQTDETIKCNTILATDDGIKISGRIKVNYIVNKYLEILIA